jgi:predicted RNase H-like nuclease
MPLLAGADGCKNGWVVALMHTESQEVSCTRASSIENIFETFRELEVLAIDVPIGLPDTGPRACDIEARAMLGRPRGSSVFPAPIRPMLATRSHSQACAVGRDTDGRGLTVQCWHILPKIREVDSYLRTHPSARARVREIHPEVSFSVLAGRPMIHPKRKLAGRLERLALLKSVFGEVVQEALTVSRNMGANSDDVLDAFVALWSAKRIYDRASITLPAGRQERDSAGLAMEIVA